MGTFVEVATKEKKASQEADLSNVKQSLFATPLFRLPGGRFEKSQTDCADPLFLLYLLS